MDFMSNLALRLSNFQTLVVILLFLDVVTFQELLGQIGHLLMTLAADLRSVGLLSLDQVVRSLGLR